MKLYLDEDLESRELIQSLRKAGHDVQTPLEVDLIGDSDAAQLTYAIRESRVCLTRNHHDFEDLHDLVLQSGGSHSGIFSIRQDNDRRRDMRPGQIVSAIKNLEGVLLSVANHLICLNDWR
jgi:hypothetical protein